MSLGAPDASGRAAIEPTGSRFRLPVDTVVAAIGQQPRPELEQWLALPLPVQAGGDVVNGGASVVQAVAEGKVAARAIEEALCRS
jgi:NADPH-dependent glutamate synthase beta subunit-like oxidoreductase